MDLNIPPEDLPLAAGTFPQPVEDHRFKGEAWCLPQVGVEESLPGEIKKDPEVWIILVNCAEPNPLAGLATRIMDGKETVCSVRAVYRLGTAKNPPQFVGASLIR